MRSTDHCYGEPRVKAFEMVKTLRSVSKEAPKLFDKQGVFPDVFMINMREGATLLCLNVPRRLSIGLRKQTKDELDIMENLVVNDKERHRLHSKICERNPAKGEGHDHEQIWHANG